MKVYRVTFSRRAYLLAEDEDQAEEEALDKATKHYIPVSKMAVFTEEINEEDARKLGYKKEEIVGLNYQPTIL